MTSDVIDRTVYDELKGAAGAEFVVELANTFLEEAPGMFAELRIALDTGDADGFRRAAHSIKANANIFGAHTLAAPARELELMEMSGAMPEARKRIARMETELARVCDALKRLQHG